MPGGAPPRPKSIILDIYGNVIRHGLGTWLSTAQLVALLADLGLDGQSARSAISRMKRAGLLAAERRGGRAGYTLGTETRQLVDDGDRRIFHAVEPADLADGWTLAVFSVPEPDRAKRHVLRSRLGWLGFGNPVPGVWIAPRRLAGEARRLIERHGLTDYVDLFDCAHRGFGDVTGLVARAWDLERLAGLYRAFVADQQPVLARWEDGRVGDDRAAFADYLLAVHQWRKLPYLDPGLPAEVLPPGWPGREAAELFASLVARLETPAMRHVGSVLDRGAARRAA
ncbi:MAG: PaaX family transcriptional regulator [Thermoleophilia bacterium]|nr:PaaX family transcriptional regulator [Thermoleophilia bacterium]